MIIRMVQHTFLNLKTEKSALLYPMKPDPKSFGTACIHLQLYLMKKESDLKPGFIQQVLRNFAFSLNPMQVK